MTAIVEVDGMEGDIILIQPLFAFRQTGMNGCGEVIGHHVGLGQAPRFYEKLRDDGVDLDRSIFDDADGHRSGTC